MFLRLLFPHQLGRCLDFLQRCDAFVFQMFCWVWDDRWPHIFTLSVNFGLQRSYPMITRCLVPVTDKKAHVITLLLSYLSLCVRCLCWYAFHLFWSHLRQHSGGFVDRSPLPYSWQPSYLSLWSFSNQTFLNSNIHCGDRDLQYLTWSLCCFFKFIYIYIYIFLWAFHTLTLSVLGLLLLGRLPAVTNVSTCK